MANKGKAEDQMELIGPDGDVMMDQLAQRIDKTVGLIQQLRGEKQELEEELTQARARVEELEGGSERLSELEEQSAGFEKQKDEIRSRIEGLLEKFDRIDEG